MLTLVGTNCTNNCNGHGVCFLSDTGSSSCFCYKGYTGETCLPSCDPDCVHGTCTATNYCTCDQGWEGTACQYSNPCSAHNISAVVPGEITAQTMNYHQAGQCYWNVQYFLPQDKILGVQLRLLYGSAPQLYINWPEYSSSQLMTDSVVCEYSCLFNLTIQIILLQVHFICTLNMPQEHLVSLFLITPCGTLNV